MPTQTRIVAPGPSNRTVWTADGEILAVPDHWELLPPGDAGLTRKVKSAGPSWTVQVKVRRRMMSRGVWAPKSRIDAAKLAVVQTRSTPTYARRRVADQRRRDVKQGEYVQTFEHAVLEFLAFDPAHAQLAAQLARAVAVHATPVGSGTVARTERIPVEERAAAAVIAWMRHQTTAYDDMAIPRVKGMRREVRRMLAERSRRLLGVYRTDAAAPADCPLRRALANPEAENPG